MDGSAIIEEKYRMLFDQQMKKVDKQMQLMKDTIQAMAMEFQAVKSQMADLQQMRSQILEKAKQPDTQKALPSDAKPATHPRQGNYKPADVDIQKMFYFGHK